MSEFLSYTVAGLVFGCVYAMTASGLVVTYTTSGIFNFAHGAIGMVAAFCYWQLTVHWGWPSLLALLFILLVGAPLFGAGVEKILMRRLEGASLEVNLTVTLGLLVFLIGVANVGWNPTKSTRIATKFFGDAKVGIFGVNVSYHELIVMGTSVLVAIGLRVLFSRTRTGIAMRAVVDNRDLAAMAGANPARVSQLSWALGSSLAALAGILLAPLLSLHILFLTLVIINAFAAAMVGRLKNLTQTVVGALILGLALNYAIGYPKAFGGFLATIQNALPMILLFGVVVFFPQERLRTSTISSLRIPAVPSLRTSLISAGALVVGAAVLAPMLGINDLASATRTMVFGLILLSVVLLTGYGGQVSLCQMTFVGLGAFAMGKLGSHGSPLGIVAAVAFSAFFGALVSLPTLRLRGLYLALSTLAFAQGMDYLFFNKTFGAYGGSLEVQRLHIPGIPTGSDRGYFILCTVLFAASAVGVLAIRRSRFGRKLAALNDSPAACATLGVNINYTKLAVFSCSAGIAGLGGALYGGAQHLVTPNDFALFTSLTLLLILLVGGRNTVIGAFFGAFSLAYLFPLVQSHFPQLSDLQSLLTGLGAITIGQTPNGIGGRIADASVKLRAAFAGGRRPAPRAELEVAGAQ